MPNGKICYVELPATDIEASANFYTLVFAGVVALERSSNWGVARASRPHHVRSGARLRC